jgi:hypothetical protein
VPIAIPSFARWVKPCGAPAAPTPDAPPRGPMVEPFVPPHQMVLREDFGLALDGGSPSACIKRERLRTRNAILRVTGFLESGA